MRFGAERGGGGGGGLSQPAAHVHGCARARLGCCCPAATQKKKTVIEYSISCGSDPEPIYYQLLIHAAKALNITVF